MKLKDERSDALELIQTIKQEMNAMRTRLAELEYLIYSLDDRCEIRFFEGRNNDKGRSEERTKAN